MTDRLAKIGENGRATTRGLIKTGPFRFLAFQDRDETLTYTLDLTGWLDGDTISSVALVNNGPTVTKTNTTTTVTLTASGVNGDGDCTVRITTAASLIKDILIRFRETNGTDDDYGD